MDDSKYQIFVSSTYEDLIQHRKKVIETVLSLYHFPVGMEMFSADDAEQWDIIRETIDVSDYYIVIIGHRYGSTGSQGLSYTEMEYDYAKSLGIPVLAFVRNRNVATTGNERENDPERLKKLDDFIAKAKSNKMCDFWEGIDDLAAKVAIALPKVMRRTPRTGWVRANDMDVRKVSQELARLSAENNDLRDKIEKYESAAALPKDFLQLDFISEEELSFTFQELNEHITLPGKIDYEKLDDSLKGLVSHSEINKFNENIPTQEETEQYLKYKLYYQNYLNNSKKFEVKIINCGVRPASNVTLFISYPEFLYAMRESEAVRFYEPELKIPESPLNSINDSPISTFLSQYANLNTAWALTAFGSNANSHWHELPSNQPSVIRYEHSKLLQSLVITFDTLVFVPTATGEGEIICQWICEELPMQMLKKIKVKVS
ncbi:hypothetical protein BEE12_18210 [Pantoea agglomerans]|uniref:DUF4062 domain-containing protein n=1 Tax=Enterobacter agglomerans TaxID=549 RepID=UPI00083CE13B|nr:DUF4062 domain-containing protein [Pantoea agglomerans]AOE41625.1 hypothetical protein BEE12_18210 [Pantoea agglomerans]